MDELEQCPVCGEGVLHDASCDHEVEHNGQTGVVRMEMSVCSVCEAHQASADQVKANCRAMKAFVQSVQQKRKRTCLTLKNRPVE